MVTSLTDIPTWRLPFGSFEQQRMIQFLREHNVRDLDIADLLVTCNNVKQQSTTACPLYLISPVLIW